MEAHGGTWLTSPSYGPTQADVVSYKAFSGAPNAEKYPHVARWYKHIGSYESEFSTLPGDPSKAYTAYGPESTEMPTNPKEKPSADDDDMDLFGSDEEEEDPEVAKQREANLEAYKKKKESKPKAVAKSMVSLEVKPWGTCLPGAFFPSSLPGTDCCQMMRPIFRRWRPMSVLLSRMVLSGVRPSLLMLATVLRSFKSTWSSKTRRSPWTIFRAALRRTRTTSSPPIL